MAENTSTGDYVPAPESVQHGKPLQEQLSQLKIAVEGKIHEFVGKANQAVNDPANKEMIRRDLDATAQDAVNSYTKALTQVGEAFHTLESIGTQVARQLGIASNETDTGDQELTGAEKEQAQQRREEAKRKLRSGQSALQQGISKVHDAISAGIAVANQKLREGSHPTTTTTDSKALHTTGTEAPTLLRSLENVISQTAQSVKDAFITPSPTANTSHATPISTNLPVTHPPAQSVSESIGQTAAVQRDGIKNTWSSPGEYPHAETTNPTPGVDTTAHKALPGDSAK